jgi:hypothetical protein
MATASMTMASNSVVDHNLSTTVGSITDHHVASREELIDTLKSSLVRYARSNDRRMVLRSLKDANFLSYIPLEISNDQINISTSELEEEVSKEKVILNDILLKPRDLADTKDAFTNYGTNSGCTKILHELGKLLCKNGALNDSKLYEHLLFRLAKTTSSADAYFQLNSIMGSADLIVKQLPEFSDMGNKSSHGNDYNNEDAIRLNLYESAGQVHMILDMKIDFGLFRNNDIASNRPWIVMKGKIHERANFSLKTSVRSLSLQTPSLY